MSAMRHLIMLVASTLALTSVAAADPANHWVCVTNEKGGDVTIIDAAERRQPLRPRFDRDAIVYAKAPIDGGVWSVCGEPIKGRAPVALIPGPDGRSRAHPAC